MHYHCFIKCVCCNFQVTIKIFLQMRGKEKERERKESDRERERGDQSASNVVHVRLRSN